MARIEVSNTNQVRRKFVAIPLMIASVSLVTLFVLYLLNFRSAGIGLFKTRLDVVSDKFEKVETNFGNALTSIISKRSPVSEFTLDVIETSYTEVYADVVDLETTLTDPTIISSLNEIITKRQTELVTLREMNSTLRAEEEIGNSLNAYNSCKKKISYKLKASLILSSLRTCKLELDNASRAVELLPKSSMKTCPLKNTPAYYVQRTIKSHELITSSYTYTSKGKAKEAAATEIEYKQVLNEIQKLPDWNSCITTYLKSSATALVGD